MRIGAYQFAISGDVNENYKEIEKAIYLAKHKDVQLLIFPECSLTGYPPRDISNSSCVNFNLVQSMCDRLQSVADQNDISFIVGTIFKEKEIYNRAFISDVGMTGPYLSSLGCDLDSVITRMRGLSSKFLISENSGQFAGVVIEFNDKHQPISIERVLINDDHLYRAS